MKYNSFFSKASGLATVMLYGEQLVCEEMTSEYQITHNSCGVGYTLARAAGGAVCCTKMEDQRGKEDREENRRYGLG